MGYQIIDQIPRGSAMSAYGAARGFRWNLPLLALVAGSLVLVGFMIWFFFARSVTVPQYRLLTVTAQPAALARHFPGPLTQTLPDPWREAIETRSHFPAFFGIALDERGTPHPFAVVRGTLFGTERLPTESVPLRHFLPDLRLWVGHDASFALRGDLLAAWVLRSSLQPDNASVLRGTWEDGMGHLRLSARPSIAEHTDEPFFASFEPSSSPSRALLSALLSQGVDLRAFSESPTSLSLSISPLENRSLGLTWPISLSSSNTTLLTQQGFVVENGEATLFDQATTTIDAPLAPPSPSSCPGSPRFVLEGLLLQRTVEALGFPSIWQTRITRFRLHTDGDEMVVCLR